MHDNALSPDHHSVIMWKPQVVQDSQRKLLPLMLRISSDVFDTGVSQKYTRALFNLLDCQRADNMPYFWQCLSHAYHWLGGIDQRSIDSSFPDFQANRTAIVE